MAKAKTSISPEAVRVAALKTASIDGTVYPIGSVIELPAALAAAHAESGEVDPAPAAVEYRIAAGEPVIKHQG